MGVGCLLVSIEALVSPSMQRSNGYEELEGDVEGEGSIPRRSLRQIEVAQADERTPLILREDEAHIRGADVHGKIDGDIEPLSTWWWIPQFLVSADYTLWTCNDVTLGFHAANSIGWRLALEWWVFAIRITPVRWSLIDVLYF